MGDVRSNNNNGGRIRYLFGLFGEIWDKGFLSRA
jgi:hypothetical protein